MSGLTNDRMSSRMPAGLSTFFFLVWLLPIFLALPACLIAICIRRGYRKPAFVISTGVAYIWIGLAHILLLFDEGSVIRGRWNDHEEQTRATRKDRLCGAQAGLIAATGSLLGFHLIGLVRDLLLESKDVLVGQALNLKRRKWLTVSGIVFVWFVYLVFTGLYGVPFVMYAGSSNIIYGVDGKLPYCGLLAWFGDMLTEVPFAFAAAVVHGFIIRNYLRIRQLPAARSKLGERAFVRKLAFTLTLNLLLTLRALSTSLPDPSRGQMNGAITIFLALSATAFAGIYVFQPRLKTALVDDAELVESARPSSHE